MLLRPEGGLARLWPRAGTAKGAGAQPWGINIGLNKLSSQAVGGGGVQRARGGASTHPEPAGRGRHSPIQYLLHLLCVSAPQTQFIFLFYRQETKAWGDYLYLGRTYSRIRIQVQICRTPGPFQKSAFPLDPAIGWAGSFL